MGGFLYFVEGMESKPSVGELCGLGLGHVFDGPGMVEHRLTRTGPLGAQGGVVVWVSGTVARGGLYPAEQTWQEMPAVLVGAVRGAEDGGAPRVFLGWESGAKPGPEDLQRPRITAGHVVTMGDGRRWMAPKARAVVMAEDGSVAWANALERRVRLDRERGVWVEDGVAVQYEELWRIAELFWSALRSAGEGAGDVVEVSFDERIEYALRCLRVNYRVGPMEAEVIELLNETCAAEVLCAVVDMPVWVALLADKKKRVTQ